MSQSQSRVFTYEEQAVQRREKEAKRQDMATFVAIAAGALLITAAVWCRCNGYL